MMEEKDLTKNEESTDPKDNSKLASAASNLEELLGEDDVEIESQPTVEQHDTNLIEEKDLEDQDEVEEEKEPKGPTTKWYSLRVISGKERKIKDRIELEISRKKWGETIRSIIVPTEKVYKIVKGKKVISERNILPGYMMVEAVPDKFTGEMITNLANTPNVIHFLGKNNPLPMRDVEARRLLGKVDESSEIGEQMAEPFIIGEEVKIIDGPFNEFVGDVLEINEDKKKMKVMVKIFGRPTEVELNYIQVEKKPITSKK